MNHNNADSKISNKKTRRKTSTINLCCMYIHENNNNNDLDQIGDSTRPTRTTVTTKRIRCKNNNSHENLIRNMKMNTKSNFHLSLTFIALLCPLLFILMVEAQLSVIRPTKFTDGKSTSIQGGPPSDPSLSASNQGPNLQQDALVSATNNNNKKANSFTDDSGPNAAPLGGLGPSSGGNSNAIGGPPSSLLSSAAPVSALPSTRIVPLRTRLCSNPNGLRYDSPLGMQSNAIDDLSLSASSFSNEQAGPQMARLNLDHAGGAWCPGKPISGPSHGKEWIQVKLNRSVVVTAIETQGRFGMGAGKEFTPGYTIEYSRNGGLSWHKWRDFSGIGVLRGNDDVSSPVKNELSPPIVGANVIRILPFSQHLRTVCLRFELHGCTYDEGAPIAYSGPDGVSEARWGHLIDHTYDGIRQHGHLTSGLGQLVDGIKGADNFSHNLGFEWVGWKSMNGDLVLEFTFKTLRNFTGALFHSNNLFSSGVEALQAMDVHYGVDLAQATGPLRDALLEQQRREALARSGRQLTSADLVNNNNNNNNHLNHDQQQLTSTVWSSNVVRIEYEPDKRLETARPVTVHLDHQLANKLRFVLKFASKWILISEVEFLSHPVELMSLASLSDQHTPALMEALATAKSYDESVAIVREHQLRRIATNAFFGISSTPASTLSSSGGPRSELFSDSGAGQAEPASSSDLDTMISNPPNSVGQEPGSDLTAATAYMPAPQSTFNLAGQQQPANPNSNNLPPSHPYAKFSGWLPGLEAGQAPASSPTFNTLLDRVAAQLPGGQQASPDQQAAAGSNQRQVTTTAANQGLNYNYNQHNQLHQQPQPVGVLTVISLVCASLILLIAGLIGLSRYRLNRQQPKLGFPNLPFISPSSAASSSLSTSSNGRDMGAIIKNGGGLVSPLMSVFSHQHQQPLDASNGQHPYQLEPYNTIFAPANQQQHHNQLSSSSNGSSVRNTLSRLASLTTSGNTTNLHHQTMKHQPPHHQLLVSLKDHGSPHPITTTTTTTTNTTTHPFAYQTNKDSAVSSGQLIVGLNQANPLAHQQIYSNNSSNCNQSNQTYATQYTASGSLSMSSSSNGTNRNQQTNQNNEYNEYATPEFGPSLANHNNNNHHHHLAASRAEMLRSSCRTTQANVSHNNNLTLSNRQFNNPQQAQLFVDPNEPEQHNYELIYQDTSNHANNGTLGPNQILNNNNNNQYHARTLSKQLRYNVNNNNNNNNNNEAQNQLINNNNRNTNNNCEPPNGGLVINSNRQFVRGGSQSGCDSSAKKIIDLR